MRGAALGLMVGLLIPTLATSRPLNSAASRFQEASRAADEFDYAKALGLAHQSLSLGGSDAETTWRIHALIAQCLAALDHPTPAADAFAQVLELHPAFELPQDVSPKLLGPLEEARAALRGASLQLRVESHVLPSKQVETMLQLDGDPMRLVAAGRVVLFDSPPPTNVELPISNFPTGARWRCNLLSCRYAGVLLDEYGNILASVGNTTSPLHVEMLTPALPPANAAVTVPPWHPTARAAPPEHRPVWKSPVPYLVGAGALLAVGAVFTYQALHEASQERSLVAQSSQFEFSQLKAADGRRQRDVWLAASGFALAGGLGVVAAAVW